MNDSQIDVIIVGPYTPDRSKPRLLIIWSLHLSAPKIGKTNIFVIRRQSPSLHSQSALEINVKF